MSSRCLSRYTKEEFAQHFGNGRNKFYIEFCCGRPCPKEINRCAQCLEKSARAIQASRRFEHGNVCDPIPDDSHIYGGKWYHNSVNKYGVPPVEIIEFALSYQREARGDFVVEQPDYEAKDRKHTLVIDDDMPRAKKATTDSVITEDNIEKAPLTKKGRKRPSIVATETTAEVKTAVDTEKPKRGRKKPQILDESATVVTVAAEAPKEPVEKKKATGGAGHKSKKTEPNPYSSLISSTTGSSQMVYKEVTLPTHLESSLEEFDTDGYEIEYVKLSIFEHKSSTYFRDSTKHKIYKKIKDNRIGEYVGRYNPDTDSILSDIPDSDDETEN
jgi:hypothetical protein